jgi:hypothetical protein
MPFIYPPVMQKGAALLEKIKTSASVLAIRSFWRENQQEPLRFAQKMFASSESITFKNQTVVLSPVAPKIIRPIRPSGVVPANGNIRLHE